MQSPASSAVKVTVQTQCKTEIMEPSVLNERAVNLVFQTVPLFNVIVLT